MSKPMKIHDAYNVFLKAFERSPDVSEALKASAELQHYKKQAKEWGIDLQEVGAWMRSDAYAAHRKVADGFLKRVPGYVEHIEEVFRAGLVGDLMLGPSLLWFDGFARYDSGYHQVIFGVDFPDADEEYLKALLAHELSHVYRDHQPAVWASLQKPLSQITRREYLDASTAEEHLVSEGLATLFSQVAFPDVIPRHHYYYSDEELKWCLEHEDHIESAISACLKADQNVWAFYGEHRVQKGSPSRTHYFFAAQKIKAWLSAKDPDWKKLVVEAHSWPASAFDCFKVG